MVGKGGGLGGRWENKQKEKKKKRELTRSLVADKVELQPVLKCVLVDVILHSHPVRAYKKVHRLSNQ